MNSHTEKKHLDFMSKCKLGFQRSLEFEIADKG